MEHFHVLVGPNASGKSTYLDVVAFLSDMVRNGLQRAATRLSPTFNDLLFRHEGQQFELAIEVELPQGLATEVTSDEYDVIRYEVAVRLEDASEQMRIEKEAVRARRRVPTPVRMRGLFPESQVVPKTLFQPPARKAASTRRILTRTEKGRANYYSETYKEAGKGWNPQWDLAVGASALANLPEDREKFPLATWFKRFLLEGVEKIQLDSVAMRQASAPGQGSHFKRDGSNLPWVVYTFSQRQPERFREWVDHLRTALPDLETVVTVEREDDRHRYLKIKYAGGLEVPSWMASDGTLRLLALTLPAYLDDLQGVLLIEEPENGVHPRAVETLIESLRNVEKAQILVATHSPVILGNVEPSEVLCFAKDDEGAADIVRGSEHPSLTEWRRDVSLGTLFAAGVLS